MSIKDVRTRALLKFFDILFWTFLVSTILHVIFLIFIPDASEWPGKFPYEIDLSASEFWAPFLRHWSLFPQHFHFTRFIDIINGAFLTMFVHKIGMDVKDKSEKGERVPPSTYVEWAMGALVSGIIFASARVSTIDVSRALTFVFAIFMFSFVSYYFLYRLRQRLKVEEEKIQEPAPEE